MARYRAINRIRKRFKSAPASADEKYGSSRTMGTITHATGSLEAAIERYVLAVNGDMNLSKALRVARSRNSYYIAHIEQSNDCFLDSIVIMSAEDFNSYVVAEVVCRLQFNITSYVVYSVLEDNFSDVDRMLFILNT